MAYRPLEVRADDARLFRVGLVLRAGLVERRKLGAGGPEPRALAETKGAAAGCSTAGRAMGANGVVVVVADVMAAGTAAPFAPTAVTLKL